MSPEVLCSFDNNAQGYGKEVDWWSIGCIFVEMLAGFTPFAADSPDAVFDNIKNHTEFLPVIMKEYITPNFSADAADLIQKYVLKCVIFLY
jgi:serine/threonine-protein kinase RIM15